MTEYELSRHQRKKASVNKVCNDPKIGFVVENVEFSAFKADEYLM